MAVSLTFSLTILFLETWNNRVCLEPSPGPELGWVVIIGGVSASILGAGENLKTVMGGG